MSGINDVILRTAPGTPADVLLGIPHAPDPDASYDLVLNDPPVTSGDAILWPPGVGDGVTSHRNANLVGLRATAVLGNFPTQVALTGLSATATQGRLFSTYVYDSFTGVNGTVITSHVGESGADWLAGGSTIWDGTGSFVDFKIQSNRLRGSSGPGYVIALAPGVSQDRRFYVESQFRGGLAANTTDIGMYVGLYTDNAGPTGIGYYMGYNPVTQTLDVIFWSPGTSASPTVLITSSDPLVAGDVRTLRLEASKDPTGFFNHLRFYVNGVFINEIDNNSVAVASWTGNIAILSYNASGSSYCDLEYVQSGPIDVYLDGTQGIATATPGTIVGVVSGGSSVNLVGNVATATGGTIVPEIGAKPLGRSATATGGILTPDLSAGTGNLVGNVATLHGGVIVPFISVGAVAPLPPSPLIVDPYPNYALTPFTMTAEVQIANNSPVSVVNKLKYVTEYFSREGSHGYVPGEEGSRRFGAFASQVSITVGGDGWVPGSHYNPTTYYGDEYTPATTFVYSPGQTLGSYIGGTITGVFKLPNGETYDCGLDFGGHFSVDQAGMVHWVHTRALGRTITGYGDGIAIVPFGVRPYANLLYVYQNENSNPRSLPKACLRPQIFTNNSIERLLGLYAHSHDIVYAFYVTKWETQFALSGARATMNAGVLTPVITGAAMLVGGVATARAGVLGVINSNVKQVALTGLAATAIAGQIVPYTYNAGSQLVPTYRRGDGYDWGVERQLGAITASADCVLSAAAVTPEDVTLLPFADRVNAGPTRGMTTVRTGYGNVVYLCYVSDQKVGVIVMDVFTEQVFAHTLSSIPVAVVSSNTAVRPNAQVVRLSDGRSLTQFKISNAIVNIVWTKDTTTAPIITIKRDWNFAGLYPNWDTLEYRGDQVYHCQYVLNPSGYPLGQTKINIQLLTNDATTGTSDWVDWGTRGVKLDPGAIYGNTSGTRDITDVHSGFFRGYTGYGNGLPSWLTIALYPDQSFGGGFSYEFLTMWMLFWNGQAPNLGVQAEGQVGSVTVDAVSAPYAALTGQRATCSVGTMVPSITITAIKLNTSDPLNPFFEEATAADSLNGWGGFRLQTTAGTIIPAGGSVFATLTGLGITASTVNVFGVIIDKAFTGMQATALQGAMVPGITVALTGNAATCTPGVLGVTQINNVALAGFRLNATPGVLVPDQINLSAATGQRATMTPGVLVPLISVNLQGTQATSAAGVMSPDLKVAFTGLRATLTAGSLTVDMSHSLAGLRATATPGIMGNITDCNVTVVGVQATGVLGTYTTNVPSIPAINHLWVVSPNTDLFATVKPGELYNVQD